MLSGLRAAGGKLRAAACRFFGGDTTTYPSTSAAWACSVVEELDTSIENFRDIQAICLKHYQESLDHLQKVGGLNAKPPKFSIESKEYQELKWLLDLTKTAAIISRDALYKVPFVAKALGGDPYTQPFGLNPTTQQPYSYRVKEIAVKDANGADIVYSREKEIFGFLDLAKEHNKTIGAIIGLYRLNTLFTEQEREDAIRELTANLIPEKFFTYSDEPIPPTN